MMLRFRANETLEIKFYLYDKTQLILFFRSFWEVQEHFFQKGFLQ